MTIDLNLVPVFLAVAEEGNFRAAADCLGVTRSAVSQVIRKSAFENVAGDARPSGLLRIAVTSVAEQFLSGPLIASFAEAHPGITIDVTVTDDIFDIVAAGFDAGVRLGEVIEQDMVAVPLTNKEREVVVATIEYDISRSTECHGILGNWCVIAVSVGGLRQVQRRTDGSSRRPA
jgi:DNA-binding transcriptional LysR family regulator